MSCAQEDTNRKITLDNKYTLILNERSFTLKVLRYGEEWRDCTGDKLILAMFHAIEELRANGDPRL